MKPISNAIFGNDVWWIVLIKVLLLFVLLLVWTIFNVWFERRVVGKMQHRLGPIMNGPLGLGQAVADGTKLLLKEDFRPAKTDKFVFNLAPLLLGVAAFTCWTVIPFGGEVEMFGQKTYLQLTDLPVSVLFIIAIASIGIYGIVLAGWASSSTYALLGSLRSSAQMISYEVAMGLSLVAVFMFASSMSTQDIVAAQALGLNFFGFSTGIPGWYAFLLFPSFVIYVISMVGETNRAPFDLPECESELVSGYLTDYSGFRYALYFLSEYINMATVSAVATTLFLGGYRAPWPFNLVPALDSGWVSPLWFMLKVQLFIFMFVWLRGTLPRLRYDQFMHLGWKWLIPISLAWLMAVAIFRTGVEEGWFAGPIFMGIVGVLLVIAIAAMLLDREAPPDEQDAQDEVSDEPFDAFAGGYPVPPMPGQKLPELAEVVTGGLAEPAEDATEPAEETTGDEA